MFLQESARLKILSVTLNSGPVAKISKKICDNLVFKAQAINYGK
jgi:hypothetical protein